MQKAYMIQGLFYGDEGKGRSVNDIVQFSGAKAVVRYCGGSQAAHNVIAADGRHHTFRQFGSATMQPGVKTILSRHMLVNPITMLDEDFRLQQIGVSDALSRTYVEARTPILTPYHQNLNRMRELARPFPHGTCAHGIGELMLDQLEGRTVITAQDLDASQSYPHLTELLIRVRREKFAQAEKLERPKDPSLHETWNRQFLALQGGHPARSESIEAQMRQWADQVSITDIGRIADLVNGMDTVVFEGAQGVLLDENYGFAPYNTWSTTTFANAFEFLYETGNYNKAEVQKIGVLRTMATRHGPGPLVTESIGLTEQMVESHNETNAWQKAFRFGYLDMVALRYALDVIGGVDFLSITHMDHLLLPFGHQVCERYNRRGTIFKLEKPIYDVPGQFPTQDELYQKFTVPLQECEPEYVSVPFYDLKNYISSGLNARVGMVSYGPRADETEIYL